MFVIVYHHRNCFPALFTLHMLPLGNINNRHSIHFHCAGDTQLCVHEARCLFSITWKLVTTPVTGLADECGGTPLKERGLEHVL